jgi:hypothetical protein
MASPRRDEWLESMKSTTRCWKILYGNWWIDQRITIQFQQYEARLVARGFTETHGVDYTDTFSPVVRHSTMRLLFDIANEYDFNIDHIDVNPAFLNGELHETIYMERPQGYRDNKQKVCLLQRSIYGLKQASRMWYCPRFFIKKYFKQSKCDPCVYYFKSDKEFLIISLYVDNFYVLYRKDRSKIKSLLSLLQQEFSIKNLGPIQSNLGIRVTRDKQKGTLWHWSHREQVYSSPRYEQKIIGSV